MAFALVGTAGVATQGAAGAAVTPAWGTGETRVASNLLLLYVSVTGSATLPAAPSGWTIGQRQAGTSCSASVFFKIAAGADAAPTVALITSGTIAAHLEEWSGNHPTSALVVDEIGGAAGTASPLTATLAAADEAAGHLVAMAGADIRSTARATNDTWTSNNGTPTLRASNNGVSSVAHYSQASLVTTGNAAADTAIMTASITTSTTGMAVSAVSFKLYPPAPAQTAYQALIISDGPSAYWKMDEIAGVLVDAMTGNNGTVVGTGVTYGATNPFGGNTGLNFATGAGYVTVPDSADMDLVTAFTIECWVKWGASSTAKTIFGKGTGAPYLWITGSSQAPEGRVILSKGNTSDVVPSSTPTILGTGWHHVVATYNHNVEAKVWVDGVSVGGTPAYNAMANTANAAGIGSKTGDSLDTGMYGSLDEFAVYQRVLSNAEIAEHYNAGRAAVTGFANIVLADAPVGWWRLEETSGAPQDSSGNGRPGYTTGVFTQGVPGVQGNALSLNGGGTVSIIPTGSLALTNPFSIECWVKLLNGTASIGAFGDYLWGKGSDGVPNLYLGAGADLGKLILSRSDAATVVMSTTAPSWGTTWHHVVATYNHNVEAKLYFDGAAVATGAPSYGVFGTNAMDFAIGSKWAGGGGTDTLHGSIDEVAIYLVALPASKVLEHYNAGVPPPVQSITLGLLTSTSAVYAPTLVGLAPDQALTVPLLTSASALYSPTVVPDQLVTLGFLDANASLYAPGLAIDQFLTIPLLSTIPDLYPPDVLQASTTLDVTLGFIDGVPSLYSPTLTPKVTLSLSLLDSPPALFAPAVLQQQYLTLGLLTSASLLYGPTLSVGPVLVATPLLDAGPTLYGPTLVPVAPAAGTITLGLLDAVPALFPPTTFLDQFVVAPLLDAVPALFAPSVQPAPTGVTIPLLTSVATVYSPTVAVGPVTVTLPQLVSTSVLYGPLLSGGGSVTLSLNLLDSPAVLYAPSLSTKTQLTLPLLTSLAVQYNLSVVAAPAGVTLSLLDSGRAVYSPQLSAINPLTLPHLSSVPVLYPPSVDDDIYVWTPLLFTIPDLFPPVVHSVADEAGELLAYNITKQEFWPTKPYNPHVYPLRKK